MGGGFRAPIFHFVLSFWLRFLVLVTHVVVHPITLRRSPAPFVLGWNMEVVAWNARICVGVGWRGYGAPYTNRTGGRALS